MKMNLHMKKPIKDYLALALDNYTDKKKILNLIEKTKDSIGVSKIGLEQFIRFGPEIIDDVQKTGNKIFLDLKLHDIPNTVAKAVIAASEHTIDYLTLHTGGGLEMMKAAVNAARNIENPPELIGVTVLTSIDQNTLNNDLRINGSVTDQVIHLAQTAVKAELDGIVCSAVDLPAVKQYLPEKFEVITPGIRLTDISEDDQKRVAKPQKAIENGATLLVIGRPITEASDPKAAAKEIFSLINSFF